MKTLLLSNINMQPLVGLLKPSEVVCGEYNSLLMDLVDPASRSSSDEFDRLLCLFDTDALMGDGAFGEDVPDHCARLIDAVQGFCARNPGKIVLTHTFCAGSDRWLNFADILNPQSIRAREAALNEQLIAVARKTANLLLIDLDVIMRRHGEAALVSPTFWYAGRIRYTRQMSRTLATTIAQAFDAYANRARKVLVLDLDNTLWGGIVGELGPIDIALSEEGPGRCFRDFQRALKALTRTGVLLVICSKNNPEDVDEVFERNKMMVLGRDDFAAMPVNWSPSRKTWSISPTRSTSASTASCSSTTTPWNARWSPRRCRRWPCPTFPPRSKICRPGSPGKSCRAISANTRSARRTATRPRSTRRTRSGALFRRRSISTPSWRSSRSNARSTSIRPSKSRAPRR